MVTNNSANYRPTQYNVQTGGASGTLNNVAPSATSGVPVISQGSSSQPVFGTAVVGGGGTGITTATAYGVLTAGTTSTGNFQVVTPGASGTILQSGGASALPTWVANSGVGSLALISTQTASASASVSFTSGITYNNLYLSFSKITASTNGAYLLLRVSTNGGSSYVATGYVAGSNYVATNGTTYSNTNNTTLFFISYTLQSGGSFTSSGYCDLWDITSGAYVKQYCNAIIYNNGGTFSEINFGHCTTTSVNALQVSANTGTFSGTVSLYGYNS